MEPPLIKCQNIMHPSFIQRFYQNLIHRFCVGPLLRRSPVGDKTFLGSQFRQRQTGAALVEVLAGVSVLGTVTAVALNHNEEAERLALQTHAQVTASAIHSAVVLQQAKWAVNRGRHLDSGLVFSAHGIPMGIDLNPEASQADCEQLWSELVSLPKPLGNSPRYWSIAPRGQQCRFSYHYKQLPPVHIDFHTQSGDITYAL